MGPIWFYFVTLLILWGFIGLIRGFKKELGVTIILLTFMLIVYLIQMRLVPRFIPTWPVDKPVQLLLIYQGLMLFGAFIAYQGYTLTFQGADPRGLFGWIYAAIVGLLNGYLLWGTIWYYTNMLGYPGPLFNLPVSPLDQILVGYTPFAIIPPEYTFWVLLGSLFALLIVRVIR
ncbi:MAG: hypothetical protein U0768_07405 [Anaerolineae bacterium]